MQLSGLELDEQNFPRHVGIIMDGNGRWAEERNISRNRGHRAGMVALRELLKVIDDTPIEIVSVFSFSKENWKRSQEELKGLFNLLRQFFRSDFNDLCKRQVKVVHSGDYHGLESDIIDIITEMQTKTASNTGKILNFALNYSGRNELVRAAARLLKEGVAAEQVDESLFAGCLDNPELGDIDLLIRTSGEMRISNFSLWQLAYAELYFTDVYWPDFTGRHLAEAVYSFQQRERRFGGRNC